MNKSKQVILNLIQDLRRFLLSFINGRRGRCQIKFDMTSLLNNGGFTLIELLVVVLIIGILAAIALPQYQKAVLRSRFAALKPLAKAVKNAQEIYYNEHGQYAAQLSTLDIQAPSDAELELSDTDGHEFVRAKKTGLNNRYTMYFDHSAQFAGNVYCEALTTDTQAMAVCAGEGGTGHTETNGEYTLYLLSGNGAGEFSSAFYVFDSPATVAKELGERFSNCGGDYDCFSSLFSNMLEEEKLPSEDYSNGFEYVIGDWKYTYFLGSSIYMSARSLDGATNVMISYWSYGSSIQNPTISCSTVKGECGFLCGSPSSCSVSLNDLE